MEAGAIFGVLADDDDDDDDEDDLEISGRSSRFGAPRPDTSPLSSGGGAALENLARAVSEKDEIRVAWKWPRGGLGLKEPVFDSRPLGEKSSGMSDS